MYSKFAVDFQSDQDEELTQQCLNITQAYQNTSEPNKIYKKIFQTELKSQVQTFSSKKIQRNAFFTVEGPIQQQIKRQTKINNLTIVSQQKTQNIQPKSNTIRRKKVSTSIKLQPLNTLRLKKDVQIIQLQNLPLPTKTQSLHNPASNAQLSRQTSQSSVYQQKMLNFQIEPRKQLSETLAQQEQVKRSHKNQSKNRTNRLLFEDEDQKEEQINNQNKIGASEQQQIMEEPFRPKKRRAKNTNQTKQETKQNGQKQQTFKRVRKNKNLQQIKQKQQNQNQSQSQNQQSRDKNAEIDVQQQPNPEKKNAGGYQEENRAQSNLFNLQCIKSLGQNNVVGLNMNKFIHKYLQPINVLNLRMTRIKSLLNLFSPEFKVFFAGDNNFVMASKKTSSKPSSTFVFTTSEYNFEQSSNKYLGKMKSNIAGNTYNIYGPGLNPQNARVRNTSPRQLLATIVYKTQFFGTGRPKQFTIYMKKQQFSYYRDFKGVQMWQDERDLADLYNNHFENRHKIQILTTRKPIFHIQNKQYVMDFDKKVKISSIKNFIIQNRNKNNQKVLLFGKYDEDNYVLDIHNPLSPLIGLAISMSAFDSRMGSE